jgi:hypothetical protein
MERKRRHKCNPGDAGNEYCPDSCAVTIPARSEKRENVKHAAIDSSDDKNRRQRKFSFERRFHTLLNMTFLRHWRTLFIVSLQLHHVRCLPLADSDHGRRRPLRSRITNPWDVS